MKGNYMTYLDFVETMKEEVGRSLNDTADVEVVTVNKNNGIKKTGLTIRGRDKNIAPTIYLESLYESFLDGTSETSLCNQIISLYLEHDIQSPDLSQISDYSQMKKRLACRVVAKESNAEMLKDLPYKDFMDLALIFEIELMDSEVEGGSIVVRNEFLDMWHITKEELIHDGIENAPLVRPAVLYSMDHFLPPNMRLEDIVKEDSEYQFDPHHLPLLADQARVVKAKMEACPWEQLCRMMVLSNNTARFGAAALAYPGVLSTIAGVFESDFYILPSSVQEVILLPDVERCDTEELKYMIHEVNRTEVRPEEKLSDSLYFYDRKDNKLVRV